MDIIEASLRSEDIMTCFFFKCPFSVYPGFRCVLVDWLSQKDVGLESREVEVGDDGASVL